MRAYNAVCGKLDLFAKLRSLKSEIFVVSLQADICLKWREFIFRHRAHGHNGIFHQPWNSLQSKRFLWIVGQVLRIGMTLPISTKSMLLAGMSIATKPMRCFETIFLGRFVSKLQIFFVNSTSGRSYWAPNTNKLMRRTNKPRCSNLSKF